MSIIHCLTVMNTFFSFSWLRHLRELIVTLRFVGSEKKTSENLKIHHFKYAIPVKCPHLHTCIVCNSGFCLLPAPGFLYPYHFQPLLSPISKIYPYLPTGVSWILIVQSPPPLSNVASLQSFICTLIHKYFLNSCYMQALVQEAVGLHKAVGYCQRCFFPTSNSTLHLTG